MFFAVPIYDTLFGYEFRDPMRFVLWQGAVVKLRKYTLSLTWVVMVSRSGNGELIIPAGNGELIIPAGNGELIIPAGNGELIIPAGDRELKLWKHLRRRLAKQSRCLRDGCLCGRPHEQTHQTYPNGQTQLQSAGLRRRPIWVCFFRGPMF